MKMLLFILSLLIIGSVFASNEDFYVVCGGDENFMIGCLEHPDLSIEEGIIITGGGYVNNTEEFICSIVYDFIIENYKEGNITYFTEQLLGLTDQINRGLGSDLSTSTIMNYIKNYPDKCYGYQELPASYLVEILKAVAKIEEKGVWSKYRYEITFLFLIGVGIFGFIYLDKEKKAKKTENYKNAGNI